MKVLFLTRYPVEGASSRYRVYQYLPALADIGVIARVSSFMSSRMYRTVFSDTQLLLKAWLTLLAVIRRVCVVLVAWRYDVVVMQRELLPFGPPFLERLLCSMGIATVFDYDDALFVHKDSKHNRLASKLRRADKVPQIFAMVDAVCAGNEYLAECARPYCDNAVCIEVAEDTRRIPLRDFSVSDRVVIGWLGSPSTEKYLELIRPVLEELFKSHDNLEMHVVGGGDFHLAWTRVQHIPWQMETEVETLLRFDIGLMPLPLEEWSKGKSGGKARTYMAAGVVPVCSAIGYNLELIDQERTGFLVETPEQWLATLNTLVESRELRERIGRAARAEVERRFSVTGQAEKLKNLLDTAIEHQRRIRH
ncbi:MAG: glycosyltransferase family 4 protein [Porticoccaceae bacterium]